jgi:hypothetical protein
LIPAEFETKKVGPQIKDGVMDSHSVFKKSARGAASFAAGSASLSPAHRAVLIMLDGKRPLGDVYKLGAVFGDCDLIIEQLLQANLIEAVATDNNAPQQSARVATAAQITGVKSAAAKHLFNEMGSESDRLSLKIERSKSLEELIANISVASSVLRDAKGDAAAARLETLLNENLS